MHRVTPDTHTHEEDRSTARPVYFVCECTINCAPFLQRSVVTLNDWILPNGPLPTVKRYKLAGNTAGVIFHVHFCIFVFMNKSLAIAISTSTRICAQGQIPRPKRKMQATEIPMEKLNKGSTSIVYNGEVGSMGDTCYSFWGTNATLQPLTSALLYTSLLH